MTRGRTAITVVDTGTGLSKDLGEYRAAIEDAIARTEPRSQRARVLASLRRFTDEATRAIELRETAGVPGFRLVGAMLEVRDIARQEQAWIQGLLQAEAFPRPHEDLLLAYRMMLAAVESATIMAIAYVGSDRERSPEAEWWSHRAATALAQTMGISPTLMALPEDRRREII